MTHLGASVSDKEVEKFKKICEKEGIKFDNDDDCREAANNLVDFMSLLVEGEAEEQQRKHRLVEEPKGFEMNGEGRTCPLCRRGIEGAMWYDKWGMKCMSCQRALDKKIVPGYVFNDYKNEKHITSDTLTWKMDIHGATIRKLVRQGKLKARTIAESGILVFLRKENPDLTSVIEHAKQVNGTS